MTAALRAMDAEFDAVFMAELSALIADNAGLHFPEHRWPDLMRGFAAACRDLGFEDVGACARWLKTSKFSAGQMETLAAHLTVGETYFFRDPASFEVLEKEILAPLVAARTRTNRTLRLWSAGCCSGEEPYSLAITCTRVVPDLHDWNVSVLATDINRTFLVKAEAGVYGNWSFRGNPEWVRERFFTPLSGRAFSVDAAIKKLVHFEYLNLARDAYPSLHNFTNAMDVIFCRNVLMYFTPEHQRTIVAALHRCLVDGGYLLVNPAESIPGLFSMFSFENHEGTFLYHKTTHSSRIASRARKDAPDPVAYSPGPSTMVDLVAEGPMLEPARQAVRGLPTGPAPIPAAALPTPDASFEEVIRLLDEGNGDAAALHLERIIENEPTLARGPLLLARVRANQGRLDEAEEWCLRATAAERGNPAAHFLYATICQEQGQLPEAVAAYLKVLYLDQDYILAHHALGGLYGQLGRPRESKRHLSITLDLLSARVQDEILPETEGMTCGRLAEIVRAMKES